MALTKLNFGGKQQALVAANIPTVTGTQMPAGTIIKTETNPITSFGQIDVPTAHTFVDLPGTEFSFTRTITTSKILVQINFKISAHQQAYLQLNRKIGSGSYAVVGAGSSGTQNGRTSEGQYMGNYYDNTSANGMAYGFHSDMHQYLDTLALGLTNTADAISYKLSTSVQANGNDVAWNIARYDGTNNNRTGQSSITFYEIKV